MKTDIPTVKKKWKAPELIIIATNDVEGKSQSKYHESSFISSRPFPSNPAFNQLFFKKAPAGVVGFNTENAYYS